MLRPRRLALLLVAAVAMPVTAQQPVRPSISYTLSIDSTHLDVVDVSIAIRNAPEVLRLAMKVHPEYDAKYWRYLEGLRITGTRNDRSAIVTREDSTLWLINLPGGHGTIHYRIRVQPDRGPTRNAWRPFMRPTGGLINSPDFFLYLPELARVPVTLRVFAPASWYTATALAHDGGDRRFKAANSEELLDSPILLGHLRYWRFIEPSAQGGATFQIAYWPLPDATPFDATALARSVRALANEALSLFAGRMPSREYWFLLQDGADDALEHRSSVTLGLPSATLARDQRVMMTKLAHEFFHTWNLVAIHPDDYGALSYVPAPRTTGLWWGEGITLYYADALTRRAGIVDTVPSRLDRLTQLATSYYGAWWNTLVSPARASLAFEDSPVTNRDATGSYYLQGELLGHVIDALIRDSTRDTRTLDDVMRSLYARSVGGHGFSEAELRATIDTICRCHTQRLFETQVNGTSFIDVGPALKRIGMSLLIDTAVVLARDGSPAPDGRVNVDFTRERGPFQLVIPNPASAWYRAGLRTGQTLVSLNDKGIDTPDDYFSVLRGIHVGDTVNVVVMGGDIRQRLPVVITSYMRARARIIVSPNATDVEGARRMRWMRGR